jgi:hypothetical protein
VTPRKAVSKSFVPPRRVYLVDTESQSPPEALQSDSDSESLCTVDTQPRLSPCSPTRVPRFPSPRPPSSPTPPRSHPIIRPRPSPAQTTELAATTTPGLPLSNFRRAPVVGRGETTKSATIQPSLIDLTENPEATETEEQQDPPSFVAASRVLCVSYR